MSKFMSLMLGSTLIASSAFAMESHKATLQFVYATGWALDGGWVTPMTEAAADGLAAAKATGKKKLSCDVKGVLKRAEWSDNVVDFLAYSITNCQ